GEVSVFGLSRRRAATGSSGSILQFAKQRQHPIASSAAEEVDPLQGLETLPEDVQQATHGRRASSTRPPAAGRAFQRRGDVVRKRPVRLLPRAPELFDEGVVAEPVDVLRGEDAGITSGRFHFAFQPLEVLAGIRAIRQDVYGLLQWQ